MVVGWGGGEGARGRGGKMMVRWSFMVCARIELRCGGSEGRWVEC